MFKSASWWTCEAPDKEEYGDLQRWLRGNWHGGRAGQVWRRRVELSSNETRSRDGQIADTHTNTHMPLGAVWVTEEVWFSFRLGNRWIFPVCWCSSLGRKKKKNCSGTYFLGHFQRGDSWWQLAPARKRFQTTADLFVQRLLLGQRSDVGATHLNYITYTKNTYSLSWNTATWKRLKTRADIEWISEQQFITCVLGGSGGGESNQPVHAVRRPMCDVWVRLFRLCVF